MFENRSITFMYIYFFLWGFLCLIASIDFIKIPLKQKLYFTLFSILIISLFCGLRGNVDGDYNNYVGYWNNAPYLAHNTFTTFAIQIIFLGVEPGFILTCSLLKSIGLESQSIFIFCSFLTFGIFFKIVKKISPMPNLSLLIFFSLYIMLPFMQIRFGVAMVCIFYGIICWREEKKRKSILLFFVAASFHTLTWGCILALPLLKLKIKYLICFSILSFCIPSSLIRTIVSEVFNFMGSYADYIKSEEELSMLSVLFNIIIILPVIYMYKLKQLDETFLFLIKSYLISIIIYLAVRDISILGRIAIVFSISSCIIIPQYLKIMKQNNFHFLVFALLIFSYCLLKYIPCLKFFEPYKINFIL